MSTGGWIFSIVAMSIVLALVVGAVAWIAREFNDRRGPEPATAMSARDILDRRLANGEIDAEQFEQLRQTLVVRPGQAPDSPPARPAHLPG